VCALSAGEMGTARASTQGMSHRHVEALIGRLATDPKLGRRFEDGPAAVLREMVAQGYELSSVEIDALASIDRGAIRTFAGALDPRLRRIDHENQQRPSDE
jgi:hypothetical protein